MIFFACPRGLIERAPDSCGSCRVIITCLKFLNHCCTTLSGFQTVFHYQELLESECDTRMPLNDRSTAKCANVASIQKRPSHIKYIWSEHYCDNTYIILESIVTLLQKPLNTPESNVELFLCVASTWWDPAGSEAVGWWRHALQPLSQNYMSCSTCSSVPQDKRFTQWYHCWLQTPHSSGPLGFFHSIPWFITLVTIK